MASRSLCLSKAKAGLRLEFKHDQSAAPRMSNLSCLRLIVVGLLLAIAGPDASAAGQRASDSRSFQIYMIQWRGPTETDRGFTEYFEQEGISATFIVRNADRKAESISAFVREKGLSLWLRQCPHVVTNRPLCPAFSLSLTRC